MAAKNSNFICDARVTARSGSDEAVFLKDCFATLAMTLFFLIFFVSISLAQPVNKISLDVKGMDVIDVLKIISGRGGMNLVLSKNVSGKVTLFLKDVDVNDAFEIVILSNDLAYEKKGDIINIMSGKEYEQAFGEKFSGRKELLALTLKYAKAATLAQPLSQIKSGIGKVVVDEPTNTLIIIDNPEKLREIKEMVSGLDQPLETKVFNLNYAQADKINAKIQESISKGMGSIKIDERTNKIAVTDYPQKLAEIEKIIIAFDEKTQQVLIDAQIVEISPKKDEFAMGVDWDYWLRKNTRLITALAAPALTSASTIPNKLAFGVTAAGTSNTVGEQGQYKAILDLLQVIGETKILSSPRIMALNNQEAKILVGTKDAYITSTTSQAGSGSTVTSQSVNFVDVGIKLYVTPTINRDGFVTIKVKPEISSSTRTNITSEGQITQIPIVTTSETETTIMVKDGTTIIIAGLKKDRTEDETQKIPFLGDIPLLGNAFKNTKHESLQTELVIFITPHIVSGEEPVDYTSLTGDKDIVYLQEFARAQKASSDKSANLGSFTEYNAIVINKIKQEFAKLGQADKGLKGEATVLFVLGRDGKLNAEPQILTSTNNALNPIAVKSIQNASPFPQLPDTVKDEEERFKICLSYQ